MLQDYPAERIILGGIFQYGKTAFVDVQDILETDTFTDETNAIIFKAYQYLFEEKSFDKLDLPSLHAAINHLDFSYIFQDNENEKQLKVITNTKTNLDSIRPWAIKIRKLHVARELQYQLKLAEKSLNDVTGDETVNTILGLAENPIFDLVNSLHNKEDCAHIATNIDEYIDYLKNNIVENPGVSTGYPLFDRSIGGGLRRKTISMIGARSKGGKSFLAINIALHVSGRLQIPVLYLDTEMDKEQQICRILPSITKRINKKDITITEVETGKFSLDEHKLLSVNTAKDKLKQTKFYYQNISAEAPENVISIIRRWVYKNVGFDSDHRIKDCLIVYDWIRLANDDGLKQNVAEHQRIGFIMANLHALSVKLDIPILGFSQLNRDGIDKESVSAVSQSDRIIWTCSNFSIWKAKSDEEIANDGIEYGNRKMVPIIARHGQGLQMGDYINYQFDGGHGFVRELDTKHNTKIAKEHDMINLQAGENIDVGSIQDEIASSAK
jgi:replicative DNA helicase